MMRRTGSRVALMLGLIALMAGPALARCGGGGSPWSTRTTDPVTTSARLNVSG